MRSAFSRVFMASAVAVLAHTAAIAADAPAARGPRLPDGKPNLNGVAHHAFAAEFDGNRPVNLQGKVTRVEWINPHAWIHIDAKDSLVIGTELVVRGYQSKDALCKPKCRANGRDVTFPDGRKLFMGSSGTGAPKDGSEPVEEKK